MMFLTHYCDDSGTNDPSPVTAIGGPVMSKQSFKSFDGLWAKLLDSYGIFGPLHMRDFVRPHGRHIGIYPEMKLALFSAVAKLINQHKFYSAFVGIPQPDFRGLMPEEARKELIGPYALAFFLAVMVNQSIAGRISNKETVMACLVDHGSSHPDQLIAAHRLLQQREAKSGGFRHTAAMGFDTDERISALQAADVIAWCARKRQIAGPLSGEFAQLSDVVAEHHPKATTWIGTHAHVTLPPEGIEMWAKPIRNWLRSTGSVPPTLEDFLR